MKLFRALIAPLPLGLLVAMAGAGSVLAQPAKDAEWARVAEDDRAIKIETDKLEAVIPKKDPKQWMTGIEKGSFLDKTTGFREVGDGLMVVDWLMEPGSDEAWADKVIAPDGNGVGRYTWYDERDRPGAAVLRPDGPRQQPPQADGRGAAALPPDEARPARDHPRQGFRRGEDDLPVRVRRPRPQARLAVDATDRLPEGRAVFRPDGPDRQRERLGRRCSSATTRRAASATRRATRSARCTSAT